ncbi:MAG: hypothetical protein ACREX3_20930 [Gammaproteobacteria bacterium]
MRIAIIGWGSLIWDPRDLPREGTWKDDGPKLPIEFSRISRDARLTLVIDPRNGKNTTTLHVLSPRSSLSDAREDLRRREGTSEENIGWVDLTPRKDSRRKNPKQTDIHDTVRKWCRRNGYDGAVWTALESNFKKEMGTEFSVKAALKYLEGLPKNVRKEALRYIKNAPDCIDTLVRQKAKEQLEKSEME